MVSPNEHSLKGKLLPYLKSPQALGILLIALVIPFTYYMVGQRTQVRQEAAETFGNMKLDATFNSIGIEVDTSAAKGTLEFKKSSDATWRKGLDLWQAAGSLYGKALLLDPGTEYDIKVTTQNGVSQGKITTRQENIPSAATLARTHYVRADGNDSNPGTSDSPSGAWKTLQKAMKDAPSGAVVQVGPGYYTRASQTRTTPITLVAQFPAVNDAQEIINPGKHSVIENVRGSRPTGSSSTGDNEGLTEAPWQQVQYTGPNSGKTYTIWKWTNSPLSGVTQLGAASSRSDVPIRIASWAMGKKSDASRVEFIMENRNYKYGFFYGDSSTRDLFIVLPPYASSTNPNDLYITIGKDTSLTFNSPVDTGTGVNVRVSGFEFRQASVGVKLQANQTYGVVDHNLFNSIYRSVYLDGDKNASPNKYTKYNLIQYNRIQDWKMRNNPGEEAPGMIAWNFIKSGTGTPWEGDGRTGESNETSATHGGGGQSSVFRYNTIDGTFNGFGGRQTGFDRYTYYNHDYHDNVLRNLPDDGFEFEDLNMNNAIWNNRVEYSLVGMSTAPANNGPIYMFRNSFYRLQVEEVPIDDAGNRTPTGGKIFKMEGMNTQPLVYFVNNTVWSDGFNTRGWTGAGGGAFPGWFMRNNIVIMQQRVFGGGNPNPWDEDYNMFAGRDESDPKTGHELTKTYRSIGDLQEYRATTGGAQHTNKIGGVDIAFTDSAPIESQMVNPQGGNLQLKADSQLIDAGVVVPNIAENFVGSAPDIGAFEVGGTGNPAPTTSVPTATPTTGQTQPTATPTTAPIGGITTPATTLSLSPASANRNTGQTFTTNVLIDSENSITNTDLSLSFNPTVLEVTDITAGTFLPNAQEVEKTINNTTGKILYSFYTDQANAKTGTGTLATITWRAKSAGASTITFDQNQTIVYGIGGGNVLESTTPATYTITGTTVPTATPTPSNQSIQDFVLINSSSHADIMPLTNGTTVNLSTIPGNKFNVRANTVPNTVGSVAFEKNGVPYRVENSAPYELEGDNGSWAPTPGTYTLKAIPYSQSQGNGTAGTPLEITFQVIDTNNTVTATPAQPTATNTVAPTIVTDPPCSITSANWNNTAVDEGTLVTLTAQTAGVNCNGKTVTFKVRENDSILEGGIDEDAATQPAPAVITGSTVTTTWRAEWQNDCNGLCNDPEYYFNATLAGGNTVRSADPLLTVRKTETAITVKVKLPYLASTQDLLNSTMRIKNLLGGSETEKTVTLVPGSDNTYTGTLQSVLTPGNYALLVKRHQFLAKKFTFSVDNTEPALDFSATPLIGGDVNNDNVINTLDLGKVVEDYSPLADTTATSDLTRDKRINALDLGIIIENYFKQGDTL